MKTITCTQPDIMKPFNDAGCEKQDGSTCRIRREELSDLDGIAWERHKKAPHGNKYVMLNMNWLIWRANQPHLKRVYSVFRTAALTGRVQSRLSQPSAGWNARGSGIMAEVIVWKRREAWKRSSSTPCTFSSFRCVWSECFCCCQFRNITNIDRHTCRRASVEALWHLSELNAKFLQFIVTTSFKPLV